MSDRGGGYLSERDTGVRRGLRVSDRGGNCLSDGSLRMPV